MKKANIPSGATFFRAFEEFAGSGLGYRVHDLLVKTNLELELLGDISCDSTAIVVARKAVSKAKKEKRLRAREAVRPEEKSVSPGRRVVWSGRT